MDIFDYIKKHNITSDQLDALVHDTASGMASNANNNAVHGQIEFLKIMGGLDDKEIISHLGG